MKQKFNFQSDSIESLKMPEHCATLEVELYVVAENEDEASFEDLTLWDPEREREVLLTELSEKEQRKVTETAERIAYECAHEAWEDSCQSRAEDAYDRYKEGD